MSAPRVIGNDYTVRLGRSVAASRFITSATDSDGDKITFYEFFDSGKNSKTGYFTVGGVRKAAGKWFRVAAHLLRTVRYVGASEIGKESVRIRAFANGDWSNSATVSAYSARANRTLPLAFARKTIIVENETRSMQGFINGRDPDGYPITKFQIRGLDTRAASSFFRIDGKKVGNRWTTINFKDLNKLELVAARDRAVENYQVRVFDGRFWSDVKTSTITTLRNEYAPEVIGSFQSTESGNVISATELFGFFDKDRNSFKLVRFIDASATRNSGKFQFNGRDKADKQWFQVKFDQIHKVKFRTNDQNHLEYLRAQVYDGKYWSDVKTTNLSVKAVARLDETPIPFVNTFERLAASEFVKQSDNGPPVTTYEFYEDNTIGQSGSLLLSGQILAPGRVHTLTAAQFNNLEYRGGTTVERQLDAIRIRMNNGFGWSDWTTKFLRTEPEAIDALKQQDPFVPGQDNTWFVYDKATFPIELNYSFMEVVPDYYLGGIPGFVRINQKEQRKNIRAVMAELDRMLEFVSFKEVNDGPQSIIKFGRTSALSPYSGFGTRPNGISPLEFLDPTSGDIWFGAPGATPEEELFGTFAPGTYGHSVLWQTLAEVMSIEHPEDLSTPQLSQLSENRSYTLKYFNTLDWSGPHRSISLYDFAAMQDMYGAGKVDRPGNDVYSFPLTRTRHPQPEDEDLFPVEPRDMFYYTIYDTDGVDTLSFANQVVSSVIDLRSGGLSSAGRFIDQATLELVPAVENVAITFNSLIENAVGGRSGEIITGNEVDNRLTGNAGDDTLRGLDGNDYVSGGRGNDTYVFSAGDDNDRFDERGGRGRDFVRIDSHYGMTSLTQDTKWKRQGKNLIGSLTLNNGLSQGEFTIVNQGVGNSRIETLRIFNEKGKRVEADIDLFSIYRGASTEFEQFKLTTDRNANGFIAVRV